MNVASIAGKDGNPQMSAYSAAKAGVIAFTKSVAKEVARTGVLVNCVVPGVIDAGLTGRAPEDERRLFLSQIRMGRMGRPEELAELNGAADAARPGGPPGRGGHPVVFLLSAGASYITGAEFAVDGGHTSHGGTKPIVDALTRAAR